MAETGGILNITFEFSQKIGTRQLPELTSEYESSVKGLYIVGDLADPTAVTVLDRIARQGSCALRARLCLLCFFTRRDGCREPRYR